MSNNKDFRGKGTLWVTDAHAERPIMMGKDGFAAQEPITVPQLFRSTVDKTPDQLALVCKRNGDTKSYTYRQYYDAAQQFAKALIKLGHQQFQGVSVLGFNSPEWFISSLGTITAGGISSGIYTTNGPEACRYIVDHSSSVVVVVENESQLNKILAVRGQLPLVKAIVVWSGNVPKVEGVYSWQEFMDLGNSVSAEDLQRRIDALKPTNCCSLIYTSGTTGPPKAVMLSHDNLTWTAQNLSEVYGINGEQVYVSYLPLSHIAAQLVDIYTALVSNAVVHFAQPDALKGTLGVTLKEVRPTLFAGVPRVWEKMQEKMKEVGRSSGTVKQYIAGWAKSIGLYGNYALQRGEQVPWGWWLASTLVFRKVRAALGLDRCSIAVTTAAPISRETLEFFLALDVPLLEVFGMSECTGPASVSTPLKYRTGSAGFPLPHTHMKIDRPDAEGNGEICWRGRTVFMGYMRNDEATAETIDQDGYLHSGDIGRIDEEGFLHITGRIKELIITAGGENVPPVLIESDLLKELGSVVSNAMVVGDRKKFLACLFTIKAAPVANPSEGQYPFTDQISPEARRVLAEIGSDATTVQEAQGCPKLQAWIQRGVDVVNKRSTSNAQCVRKFAIIDQDFAIENDTLTPTMKLKRRIVVQKYSQLIERIYEEAEREMGNA